jgi:hypothetical protein
MFIHRSGKQRYNWVPEISIVYLTRTASDTGMFMVYSWGGQKNMMLYFLCWSQTVVLWFKFCHHAPLEVGLYWQFFTVPPISSIWFLSIEDRVPCSRYNDLSNNKDWLNFLVLRPSEFFTFLMCGNSAKVFSHQFCITVNTTTHCAKEFYFQTLFFM